LPNFLQIISRIISAMETEQIKAEFPMVDVLIHPSAHADHALDFSQADALVALGEEAARQHLAECQKLLAKTRVLPRRLEHPIS
jgi:predicted acylesterase/phospholipase RssA